MTYHKLLLEELENLKMRLRVKPSLIGLEYRL